MKEWIKKIESILKENNIAYEISNNYINILNSTTATRIKVFEYQCGTAGTFVGIEVQEFDGFGNQIYSKEFAKLGKAFINRITKNL